MNVTAWMSLMLGIEGQFRGGVSEEEYFTDMKSTL
jgi:hypothetical protein